MTTTAVVLVQDAERQLLEAHGWWLANRPESPDLVLDEFERCVSLLENSPDLGARFHRTHVPGVRRLLMRPTKLFAYYVHDEANAVVYILAIWGAPKPGAPRLKDPR
jgi:plasmid stabilization system protein ParE